MPPVGQLHVDTILSNLSVQYKNAAMIWDKVMPILPVGKRSDLFFTYNKADSFTLGDDRIGATGLANEMDWGTATNNYSVTDHAFADWLAQAVIDNADNPVQPEVDTNNYLNLLLDVAQENRVANVVFNTNSYSASNQKTLAGSAQWGGGADDPLGDIWTAIESCYGPEQRANTMVLGVATWTVLRKHKAIIDAVKAIPGGVWRGGQISASELATLFELDQVLIGRSRYNTARMGQTPSFSRLWGPHASLLYVEKKPGIRSITFGTTFCEMQRQTQRDFDPKRGVKGSHYFKVAWNSDEKVIANDCGYLIQNAVNYTV